MKCSALCLAAGLLFLCSPLALPAAPARALYFTEYQSILRADPTTLETEVVFPNAITGTAQFEALYLDSPNGHIYWVDSKKHIHRGNLDGTGSTIVYSYTGTYKVNDFAVAPSGNFYLAIDRSGVIEYDPVNETTTTLHSVGDPREFLSPRLHLDPETSTLHWSERYLFYTWDPITQTSSSVELPVVTAYGDSLHKTNVIFENGTPVPYSLVASSGNTLKTLVVGGLDGNAATEIAVTSLVPTGPEISIDTDGGYIYIVGQITVDQDPVPGLFRMNLDGSGFTRILDVGSREEFVIDTTDLDDTTDPVVTIFSPIGGVTNNQVVGLYGSVAEDGVLAGISWSHDGIAQGAVDQFNGDFTVASVTLHPGDNLLEITATDLAGNSGSAQVNLTWQPLRKLDLSTDESVREGRRSSVAVTLDSPGDVAGITFKLLYDPGDFEAPKVEFDDLLDGASPTVNAATTGEVNVTFAKADGTLPAGAHRLMSINLRARSVEVDRSAALNISIQDMADEIGNPIVVGTFAGNTQIGIVARTFNGDVNSNDRLDTGDASRMQAMLTGLAEKRPWDNLINDLNGSTTLDSGDVIRVLRTVVGLEDQPAPPPAGRSGRSSSSSNDPHQPRARLAITPEHAAEGETVTASLVLENVGDAFSGAAFALDYPPEALRLEAPAKHTPGAIVGGDAFLIWNLAPSQNDYANQSGTINFGASSSASWPGSASGGTLAIFSFTVTAGASAAKAWEITLRDVEISTDSGFEIQSVAAGSHAFVGQALSFAAWQAAHFGDLAPGESEAGADPDGDQLSNAIEYFTGRNPRSPDSTPALTARLVPSPDAPGNHCLAVTFTRSLAAIDTDARLQISSDLASWEDVPIADGGAIDYEQATKSVTTNIDVEGLRSYVRLKVTL